MFQDNVLVPFARAMHTLKMGAICYPEMSVTINLCSTTSYNCEHIKIHFALTQFETKWTDVQDTL